MGVVEIEQRVLLTICRLFVNSTSKQLLHDMLQHIARTLHYDSVPRLLEEHLRYLWNEWIISPFPITLAGSRQRDSSSGKKSAENGRKRKRQVDSDEEHESEDEHDNTSQSLSQPTHFPFVLFEVHDFTTFVNKYGEIVVPIVVGQCNKDVLRSVSGEDEKNLLTNHFAPVYAYCILKRVVDGDDGIERYFTDIIGKKDVNTLISTHMDTVIVNVIWSLNSNRNDSTNQLQFSRPTVTNCLKLLASMTHKDTIASLFKATKGRIQAVLLALHSRLLCSHRVHYRSKSLEILDALITDWVGTNNLRIASVLRSTIHVLLNFVKTSIDLMKDADKEKDTERSLQESSSTLLLNLLDSVLNDSDQGEEIREVGKNARKIQIVMTEVVTERLNAGLQQTQSKSYQILQRLFAKPSQSLKEVIKKIGLEPFPDNACFKPMQEIYNNLHKIENEDDSLEDHIRQFLTSEASAGIVRLHNVFANRKSELESLLSKKTQGEIYNLLSRLSSKLTLICREELNKTKRSGAFENNVLKLASQCLASLVLYGLEQGGGESEFDTLFSSSDQVSTYTPDDVIELSKIKILQLLDGYLTDPEAVVIAETSYVLQNVLNTKLGKNAFQAIKTEADLKLYLQPYTVLWPCRTVPVATPPEHAYKPWSDELFNRQDKDHSTWVRHVTYSFINNRDVTDQVLCACAPLCLYKTGMAELLFSLCILDMSTSKDRSDQYAKNLSILIDRHVFSSSIPVDEDKARTIRLVLTTLNMLHRQYRERVKKGALKVDKQPHKYWIPIPYLTTAKAALSADSVYSALLYAEMHYETENALKTLSEDIQFEEDAPPEQDLLIDIYHNIDEPDGMYGVNRNFGIRSQLMRYEHQGDWQGALGSFDVTLLQNSHATHAFFGAANSLKNLGFDHTARMYIEGLINAQQPNITQQDLFEMKYENAWREFRVNVDLGNQSATSNTSGFNELLYQSLSALSSKDERRFRNAHDVLEPRIINALVSSTATGIYFNAARLQMLTEVSQVWNTTTNASWLVGGTGIIAGEHGFDHVEPILTLRKSLLRAIGRDDLVPYHLCQVAAMARKQGRLELASNVIRGISSLTSKRSGPWMLEEARILWKRGEADSAISIANFLISLLNKEQGEEQLQLLGETSRLCGKWLGHTGSIASHQIIDRYLKVAITNCSNKCKAYYTMARYTDHLYQNLMRKLKSEEYAAAQRLRIENEKLLSQYQSHLSQIGSNKTQSKELTKQIELLNKSIKGDKETEARIRNEMAQYLKDTLTNYGLTAQAGDNHDLHVVFRVVSLWFNNSDTKDINVAVFNLLKNKQIPARKFLPLIYQIASRLSATSSTSLFEKAVQALVRNICLEHPHQSLYQVFALKNGDKVTVKEKSNHKVDTDKIQAAQQVIDFLKQQQGVKDIVEETEKLIDAYVELAFIPLDPKKYRNHTDPLAISEKTRIRRIRDLSRVVVPTIEEQDVKQLPTVVGFEPAFRLAGGINLPKIVKCLASDGKHYRQLVKGKDDMRQDAVMQQIFYLVNRLLVGERETYNKKLRVRTYRVVPLTPAAGILGWVEHTMPMAEWLVGPNKVVEMGAHKRYRPQDISYTDARASLSAIAQQQHLDNNKKLAIYERVCTKFQPVMHHFFAERFLQPHEWFYKRLNYQRSVAANSIVGYVMGIGDRHAHNILLDIQTAECVHIDLGVAFDQGKLLPTPEQVPFRLTRDVVDGFGVTGVEGVFRRCSEATMSVLRLHADLLTLIVEVFIHDPLYRWSLSPLMALKLQRGEDEDEEGDISGSTDQPQSNEVRNRDAESALIRLREKLQGYEDGESLGVKGQVDKLINEARDPKILSLMFHGWSAHL
jgi:ataxia telangiectasia mutated family protein